MIVSRRLQLCSATALVCVVAPAAAAVAASSHPTVQATHSIVLRGEQRNTPPFNLPVHGVAVHLTRMIDEPRNTWPFVRLSER
jgi:hypothetical protein